MGSWSLGEKAAGDKNARYPPAAFGTIPVSAACSDPHPAAPQTDGLQSSPHRRRQHCPLSPSTHRTGIDAETYRRCFESYPSFSPYTLSHRPPRPTPSSPSPPPPLPQLQQSYIIISYRHSMTTGGRRNVLLSRTSDSRSLVTYHPPAKFGHSRLRSDTSLQSMLSHGKASCTSGIFLCTCRVGMTIEMHANPPIASSPRTNDERGFQFLRT
jgi:hypothetical protein